MLLTLIKKELRFSASRSSGPGGQHVNKVNTRVSLIWDIQNSYALNDDQKLRLLEKLKSKLTSEGVLILSSQAGRSQLRNKQDVVEKLNEILVKVLTRKKKRKPTKPSKASVEKRLQEKKRTGEKKKMRGRF